jgi:hypothetical protein
MMVWTDSFDGGLTGYETLMGLVTNAPADEPTIRIMIQSQITEISMMTTTGRLTNIEDKYQWKLC